MHGNQGSGRSRFSAGTKCFYSKPIFPAARALNLTQSSSFCSHWFNGGVRFSFSARFGKFSDLGHEHAFNATSTPTLLIILLGLIFAIALGKLGLDDMALAFAADRRERASDDFLKQHRPASAEERKHFEDDWDLREFGVNSQDVDPTSI
jgi:hypothetical protein